MFAPGTVLLGKLKVIGLLGSGAMGKVYEVEHLITLHRRALKVLEPEVSADPDTLARLAREASAAARAGDPRIVETFDAGRLDDGSAYLLMEKLEGSPLDAVLLDGRLSVPAACFLVAEAARGLDAAHQKGVIHRDVKPANLFLTTRDGGPFVKVVDFGMAKLDPIGGGLAITRSGTTLGTPLYMAPEQMRGAKTVDARADVYALGVVLYECLSGRRPYESDSFAGLAALVLEGQAPPLGPDVPPALRQIVSRAMDASEERRLPTARALADALGPFASASAAANLLQRDSNQLASTMKSPSSPPEKGRSPLVLVGAFVVIAGVGAAGALLLGRVQSGRSEESPTATSLPLPAIDAGSADELAQPLVISPPVSPTPDAGAGPLPDASVITFERVRPPTLRSMGPRRESGAPERRRVDPPASGSRPSQVIDAGARPPESDTMNEMK